MPITKLSAPQPHELVRKVNELVDAVNSGGGGGDNPTGSLGVRRIDYELTADQYLQYNESTEWYTLSVPYPEGLTYQTKTPLLVPILFLITLMQFLCLFKTPSEFTNNSD